ncbi:MAG TPA: HEAT repeat domain-containing protein [Verrucomicrobiae bacterium]|nr:HEAT repeat domain-containing protein [Verrucomicrobiae bacterium]
MKLHILGALLITCFVAGDLAAQTADETRLIQVLQSNAPVPEKEDACRKLKLTGTTKSVPALVALLTHEHLYQSACDVLETMPAPEAGNALRAALKTTSGNAKAAVIHALGEKRYQPATGDLAQLLTDSDSLVATAAARALGQTGSNDAIRELQQALGKATGPLRSATVDALLNGASQLLAAGKGAEARKIYQQFDNATEKEGVRTAAYAGLIRAAEANEALKLVSDGIAGTDSAHQSAALRLAVEIQDPKATAAFTNLLTTTSPPVQAALVRLLQLRGDVAAAPAVLAMAKSLEPNVRVAALTALGTLGDVSSISLLADAAASPEATEQKAARVALTELRRGEIAEAMIAQLSSANPAVQVELIRALAARMDKSSAPRLLELASTGNAQTRRTALRGLDQLADGSHLPTLVKLLEDAKDDPSRAEIQSVFESLADRTPTGQKLNVSSIAQALNHINVPTRVALLQVSAFFADARLRDGLRAALKDTNEVVRTSAARALCNSRDPQLMPELLELAKSAPEPGLRALALEGYVRLIGENDANFPSTRRVQLLKSAYALAARPEDKRLILSSLATAPNLESLQLARTACGEPGIKAEAEVACARIAKALLAAEPTAATTALQNLATNGSTANVQAEAKSILKQFDSGWLASGPYRRRGKEAMDLFDIVFPPERRNPGTNVIVWWRAPGTADLSRRGEVDLLGIAGGDQCAVYLKTRVFAPAAQDALFEIGSDDGIKLWLNGELIHTNNAVRGLTPGQDRARGKLREGWNDLFAKVTQSTAGCGMAVTIKNASGSEINGLRFDPHGGESESAFKKIQLSADFYAEGAYYGDFNRDGKLDVVAGPFWFAGPDFQQKNEIRPPAKFDPHGYSDNFLTYTADFNGDGWTDVFYVPFPGAEGYWYENPQNKSGHWQKHLAYSMVGNESPGLADVTGDGRPDLILNNEGHLGYATFDPAKPNEPWKFRAVSPKDSRFQRFTHGIGAGDINGDGRMDLVEAAGWWERPADVNTDSPWKFHPYKFAEAAAQMLVTDVDGDGLNDVINSWHCHLYGLVWNRQSRSANGDITWQQHVIMSPTPDTSLDAVRFSQLHAMELVDMNGDGLKDILTGKRFWAHGPVGDVEPDAPAVVYWFELKRTDGKVSFIPHPIDNDSGIGTQVTATDLNGDKRPDVIVANKKGIFLHLSDRGQP